jgi:hypothetical protein
MGAFIRILTKLAGSKAVTWASVAAIFGDEAWEWLSGFFGGSASSSDITKSVARVARGDVLKRVYAQIEKMGSIEMKKLGVILLDAATVLLLNSKKVEDRIKGIVYLELGKLLFTNPTFNVNASLLKEVTKTVLEVTPVDTDSDGDMDEEDKKRIEDSLDEAVSELMTTDPSYGKSMVVVANTLMGMSYLSGAETFKMEDLAAQISDSFPSGEQYSKLMTMLSLMYSQPGSIEVRKLGGSRYGSAVAAWKLNRVSMYGWNKNPDVESALRGFSSEVGLGGARHSDNYVALVDTYVNVSLLQICKNQC